MKKVCIITTVHSAFDVRIFYKEAKTLYEAGYDVEIIATNPGTGIYDDIKIIGLKPAKSRLWRMFIGSFIAMQKAIKSKADIYHFHDPELLIIGVMLKFLTGKKVIYDCHEHLAESILYKTCIPKYIRLPYAIFCKYYEMLCYPFMDAVIGVVEEQQMKFTFVKRYEALLNYPLKNFFTKSDSSSVKKYDLVYVGGLSIERGLDTILETVVLLKEDIHYRDIKCLLVGRFADKISESLFETYTLKNNLSNNIDFVGIKKHQEVPALLSECKIGLWLGKKTKQYNAPQLATKVFEYMGAKLPVISTNYEYLIRHLNQPRYIYFINESDANEAVRIVKKLLSDNALRNDLSEEAFNDFYNKYNWENEGKKLLELYKTL